MCSKPQVIRLLYTKCIGFSEYTEEYDISRNNTHMQDILVLGPEYYVSGKVSLHSIQRVDMIMRYCSIWP